MIFSREKANVARLTKLDGFMVMEVKHKARFVIPLLFLLCSFTICCSLCKNRNEEFVCDKRAFDEINEEICLSVETHSTDKCVVCGLS